MMGSFTRLFNGHSLQDVVNMEMGDRDAGALGTAQENENGFDIMKPT